MKIFTSAFIALLSFVIPFTGYGQAPDLGTASSFAVFTAAGAFSNEGNTVVTGDIGTNVGAFTGFPPGVVMGNIHVADGISATAATDVADAYAELVGLTCGQVIGVTLGNNQILTPDIYCTGAATTLNGNLTLDAQGDPNAIFIFQIDGALSTTTLSSITLINGASLCNVYWQINGAVTLGVNSLFLGTILANGALSLLEGATLLGRALSQAGAVDMHNNIVTVGLPPVASLITADGPITFCTGDSVILSGNIDGTWNNGSTAASITVTIAGDYFVVNTTICGSDTSNHIIVTINPLPECSVTGDLNICEGESTQLCASAGATGYIWNTGEITNCISVMADGIYSVTITDSNGCTSNCSVDVNVNPLPVCAIAGDTSICVGGSTELCVPAGAASYLWNTGAITNCIIVTAEGIYNVTVTDVNGCSSVCSQTVNLNPGPDCTISGNSFICQGGSTTLCAPPGASSYLWNTGDITNCITVTLEGLYTVTVTDVNGCSSICSETVSVNPGPECTISGNNFICEGGSTILCAPAGAASYLWNTGDITNCITVTLEGLYTVTVTDVNGCSSICSETVTVNPGPDCTISGNNFICEGGSTTLCAPPGASSYLWNTGDITNCITVTAEGIYSVTVTDASGCSSICSETVTTDLQPACTITGDTSICEGETTQLCTPTGAVSYLWNNGEITNCITADAGGLYSVTITYAGGCTSICDVTLNIHPLPVCTITGDTSICGGETTQLCTPPGAASYLWNTGAITNCVSVTQAGLYTVTVTDINGCISVCSENVTLTVPPVCTISGATEICEGQSTQLCAPAGAANYLWSTGSIENCITTTVAGMFSVTVTDLNGCSAVCSVNVLINPLPICTITGNNMICEGESTILCAPAGASSYLWNTGDITNCITVNSAGQYTVTVTDVNGCSSICSETVTITPGGPVSITCPADIMIECNEIPTPPNTGTPIAIGSCGAPVTVLYTDITLAGPCPQEYTIIRTWVATDSTGNSAGCNQTITIEDNQAPSIQCPANVIVECASDVPQPDITSIISSDNCGGTPLVEFIGDVISNQVCDNQFFITRTYRVTDDCGNSAECSQLITVFDNTLPSINCPANVTVECASDVPQPDITSVISSDNCGGIPLVDFVGDIISNQVCENQFQITRTYRVTDDCGNSAECSQIITVFDNTLPSIICPANVTVECASDVPQPDITSVISSDNCGGIPLVDYVGDIISNQVCENQFLITRTYRVTDDCGNSAECSQLITVFDNTLPSIICPANVTVECASDVPQPDLTSVISSDNCGGIPLVVFVDDIISNQVCENQFQITRTYRVSDDCGNSAECSQLITVFDNTLPSIICPANVTVECASDVPQPDITSVISSDNCGGIPVVVFVGDIISNQVCDNQFLITRTYRVTDDCGNSSECSQLITVFDNTLPTINCPANVTVQCAGDVPQPNTASVIASDNCGGTPVVVFVGDVVTNQLCANRFVITRTYRATDICGNSSECNQQITVFDNTLPIINCPANVTVQCAGDVPQPNTASIIASDNCGGTPVVVFVGDVISNQLCANRFVITRTYRATDICGNSSQCSQQITVFDNTLPTIICPANVTVACAGNVPQPNTASVIASDNCGGTPVVVFVGDVITNQLCANNFIINRTYRVTDVCGNSTECIQLITVFDNIPPVIVCPPNATFVCAEDVPPVNISLVVASDNCGSVTITHVSDIISNQICPDNFILTRVYRATDACGNLATCAQIITINDNIPPEIIIINPLLEPEGDTTFVQCFGQDPLWDLPQFDENSVNAIDNCGGNVTVTFNQDLISEGDCTVDGYINLYSLVWTAIDECGNANSVSVFLALVDTIPPVIYGIPGDTTVNCDDIPELPVLVYATDECLCACVILVEESMIAEGCQDGQVLVRTWTAKDRCGNETSISQRITLRDDEGPALQILLPELNNITGDTTLSYTCNEGGIPTFFNALNASSVTASASCGSSTISFNTEIFSTPNCEFFGFAEQHTFTWKAVDECGNESSLSIIARLIDNEAPVFVGLRELACIGDPTLGEVEAIDNCGNPSIRFWDVNIPNPCGNGTAVRRTYEAYDQCGNITRDTTILIPNEQIQPIVQLMNPLMSSMSPDNQLTLNCAANGSRYTTFTADDIAFLGMCGLGLDVSFTETLISLGDCNVNGIIATVELKWVAADLCGNQSELVITADIIDESGPVFNDFHPVMAIGCGDAMPEIITSDNCGDAIVTIAESIIPGDCEFEYTVIREISATDPCGNTTQKLQTIHVGGGGPVITGVDEKICDDLTLPEVTAFDACSGKFVEVTMIQDTLDIPCHDGLVIERIWTAVNSCGDTSEVHQTIIMNDQEPPVIMVPTYSVIRLFLDNAHNLVFLSQREMIQRLNDLNKNSVFVEDDCDLQIDPEFNVEVSYSDDCKLDGYFERRTYTWFIKDACDNTDSLSFTVDIMDDMPPAFNNEPNDTIVICAPLPLIPFVDAQDSSSVTIVFSEIIIESDQPGVFIVTRTWVATDACGNATEYTQVITWQPDSFLECEIIEPAIVECNSHGVVIGSLIAGGNGIISYDWVIVGEKCFIQGGQGTPEILIYTGWSQIKIILTVTDIYGCVSMCMIFLDCSEGGAPGNVVLPVIVQPETNELISTIDHSAQIESLTDLQIYPNPANDVVNVSFQSSVVQQVDIVMISFLGQVIHKESFMASIGRVQQELKAKSLPEGNYLLQIRTGEGIITTPLAIVKGN